MYVRLLAACLETPIGPLLLVGVGAALWIAGSMWGPAAVVVGIALLVR